MKVQTRPKNQAPAVPAYIFVDPERLAAMAEKVSQLATRWGDTYLHQLWQMVGTLELGLAETIEYQAEGIRCPYWHSSSTDPYVAYGGFYRAEKNQMAGHVMYLLWHTEPAQR